MFKTIFSNRYAALVWVSLALFGAAAFVGKGGGVDVLDQTAQQLRGQHAALNPAEPEGNAGIESEPAEEEEPAIEPSEAASPAVGDTITGQDGRSYRVIQAATASVPAQPSELVEQPAE
jgi:hypothetical protein